MKKVFQNSDFKTWFTPFLVTLILGFLVNEIEYGLIFAVKIWIASFVFGILSVGHVFDILKK
jgi:hypothetical protein